jgi:hypothetical protein
MSEATFGRIFGSQITLKILSGKTKFLHTKSK